uniref:Uncharacterized protein n=1 Tax=Siphoviridae sp. ctoNj20 TaxID=2826085 RepID=A0A8D9PDU5_9CAUD|nr:MAG TPA: hypothetical protein [Siphoviridae sp. ctoNj20]
MFIINLHLYLITSFSLLFKMIVLTHLELFLELLDDFILIQSTIHIRLADSLVVAHRATKITGRRISRVIIHDTLMTRTACTEKCMHEVTKVILRILTKSALVLEVTEKLLYLVDVDAPEFHGRLSLGKMLFVVVLHIQHQRVCVYSRLLVHPHKGRITKVFAGLVFESIDFIFLRVEHNHVDGAADVHFRINDLSGIQISRNKIEMMFDIQHLISVQIIREYIFIVPRNHRQKSHLTIRRHAIAYELHSLFKRRTHVHHMKRLVEDGTQSEMRRSNDRSQMKPIAAGQKPLPSTALIRFDLAYINLHW